jgi:hypothetical protein
MNRWTRVVSSLAACATLAGCLPEERFWWSPDGRRAVVMVEDRLHAVTLGGTLAGPLLPESEHRFAPDLPKGVCWEADGRSIITTRVRTFATWGEAKKAAPELEAAHVERLAGAMPALVAASLLLAGKDEGVAEIETLVAKLPLPEKGLLKLALHAAWERDRAGMEKALAGAPPGSRITASLESEQNPYQVHEICRIPLQGTRREGEVQPLVQSLQPLIFPAVAPRYGWIAYLRFLEAEELAVLEVVQGDGSTRVEVARGVGGALAWTSDGKALVYNAPVTGKEQFLQRLKRRTLEDGKGGLLPGDRMAPALDLAVFVPPATARILCLPGGKVLFAGQPVSLPVEGAGPDPAPKLYLVPDSGGAITAVPTRAGDLPTDLGYFTASPDGRYLAVVESGTDAVGVVDLGTGSFELVSPAHVQWRCRTLPAWRTDTELAFAGLSPSGGDAPAWLMWSPGARVRLLSEGWPAGATRSWLEKEQVRDTRLVPSPAEQPRSAP